MKYGGNNKYGKKRLGISVMKFVDEYVVTENGLLILSFCNLTYF